jgi:hypothetical protein
VSAAVLPGLAVEFADIALVNVNDPGLPVMTQPVTIIAFAVAGGFPGSCA